jgi:amidase
VVTHTPSPQCSAPDARDRATALARIEALNPAVNAIAATDFAHARKLAKSAESAARKGEQLGALHGLPTGIKDLDETAGLLTTYGSPLYRSHVPAHDAAMVALSAASSASSISSTIARSPTSASRGVGSNMPCATGGPTRSTSVRAATIFGGCTCDGR